MGELLEHMEHASHAGGHGHGHGHEEHPGAASKLNGKYVGMTMATLGVLMAVCAALVGASRNDLITTMVSQSSVANQYQAVSTKYRMMQSQLRSTHAFLMNDPEKAKAVEKEIDDAEKAAVNGPGGPAIHVLRLETANIMAAILPNTDDLISMAKTSERYGKEKDAAHEWVESYDDKVEAYEQVGESFEKAQLAAEIAIVIASIAMLLGSRVAWLTSCALGLLSLLLVSATYVTAQKRFSEATAKIAKSEEEFKSVSQDKDDREEDEKLVKETLSMAH
jgi:Na+/glutamate symporter